MAKRYANRGVAERNLDKNLSGSLKETHMSERNKIRVAILVVGLLAALTLVGMSAGTGCPAPSPVGYEYNDGQWVVLESHGCGGSTVITYDKYWQQQSRQGIEGDIETDELSDLEVEGGDRWVLTGRGNLSTLDEEWSHPEGRLTFTHDGRRWEYRFRAVERGPGGRWWVVKRDETVVYSPNGRSVIRRLDRSPRDLWVDGRTVGMLFRSNPGDVVRTYEIPNGWYESRAPLKQRSKARLGPEGKTFQAFHRGPQGNWRVTDGGNVYVYTEDWEYTGRRYGASATVRVMWALIMLLPFVFFGLVTCSVVASSQRVSTTPFVISLAGSTTLAILVRESLLPYNLALLHRLPDLAFAVVLLSPSVLGIYYYRDSERLWVDAFAHLLTALPLVVIAIDYALVAAAT